MNIISILIAFLTVLVEDNARLYWYVPVHKALPFAGIRVELFPFALLDLIGEPIIPVIFRSYRKGVRFAAVTGDRLVDRLIAAGCTVDEIHCIHYHGRMIGYYDHYMRAVSTWREAEIAEITRHREIFGADTAIDISEMSIAEQSALSGICGQHRKYDIFTTAQFKEFVEVKFSQAYVEDYT